METSRPKPWGRVAALAVIALFILAAFAYYEGTLASGSSQSESGSLEQQITTLQQSNQALESELAAQGQGNLSEAEASSLYSNLSSSVVTVQGYELLTQNTFFGQISSIESIQGSGFVVDMNGSPYVVTNNHVVDGASNITVTFSDGNAYEAKVLGTDPYRDLAVLSAPAPAAEFHPLAVLGSPSAVAVGETVYAIGTPLGLSGSMTVGIVSQVGRTITESESQVSIPGVIQFSAAINPGNSGGPLLDSRGDVVGITTATVSNSQGLGFAIPASTLSRELPSLISTGNYTLHPDLGISSSADMTYQLAQAVGTNVTYGVLVQSVASGGAAAQAGVRGGTKSVDVEGQAYLIGGDVIVSIDGTKVINSDALATYLEEHTLAGKTVQLGLIRSGVLTSVSVKLGSLP